MSTARKCKTKYLAKSAIIYSLVAGGLLLGAKMIFAQEQPRTISVVPPSIQIKVNPGDRQEGTLKIINDSANPLTFKAVVRDFIVDNPNGIPHILTGNKISTKYSASAWLGVSPDTFTLAPGKSEQISYFLQVPITARPGGHYAAVVYEPQEVINSDGTGAGVETHIGTLFYVRVNGNVLENASVKSFTANPFQEYGPVTINTQILNSSDTDIKPIGSIIVKNLFGQVVYSQVLEDHNIYPGAVRDFSNKIGRKLMFGRYSAELRANYGTNNNLTLFAITSFIVFPWKIVSVVVLAIIAVILLIIFLRRRDKKKTHQTNGAEKQENPSSPQE